MVRFDGKAHEPLHVDVSVRDRRDMRQVFGLVPGGLGFNCALHRCGIPGQHDIGEQGESTADGVRIILGPAMLASIRPASKARCKAWSVSPWASRR